MPQKWRRTKKYFLKLCPSILLPPVHRKGEGQVQIHKELAAGCVQKCVSDTTHEVSVKHIRRSSFVALWLLLILQGQS